MCLLPSYTMYAMNYPKFFENCSFFLEKACNLFYGLIVAGLYLGCRRSRIHFGGRPHGPPTKMGEKFFSYQLPLVVGGSGPPNYCLV